MRWVRAFGAEKLSVEDNTRSGSPKISVTKANLAVVDYVVEQDAQLSVRGITSFTGISEDSVYTILIKHLHH